MQLTPSQLVWLKSLNSSDLQTLLSDIAEYDDDLAIRIVQDLDVLSWETRDKATVADFFQVSLETIDLWQRKGMPFTSGGRGVQSTWNLRACTRWLATQRGKIKAEGSDPNHTIHREKARMLELQRLKLEGELVDLGEYRQSLMDVCAMMRRHIESLHRRFGNEVIEALNEGVDEMEREITSL